jgi:hypothetical protein
MKHLYQRAVTVLLLDAAICITLFFVTGVKHETEYLNNETFVHYDWDTSLLDVVILAALRLTIGATIWELIRS